MPANPEVSPSLARLRESVAQTRQRIARRDADADEPSPLSEPIVASANTPAERKRTRQLETLRREHLALSRKVQDMEEKAAGHSTDLLKHLSGFEGQQAQAQQALRTSQMLQAALTVASTLQTTAYGQPGGLFSTTNLLLAGNQLLWTYFDPIARHLGLSVGPAPSALAHWAPLLSLATARVVVGDRQHVRFVSGIATFGGDRIKLEGLRSRIASGFWSDFQRRGNIAVTAQALEPFVGINVSGEVRDGTLRLAANVRDGNVPKGLRVAWIVDTGDPNG
ncbi:MAG: hypothetical protein Q8O42_13780 [Acidobacteriota bacterium]|nr:hypothetical protein [Acidobacteriota bacterium]